MKKIICAKCKTTITSATIVFNLFCDNKGHAIFLCSNCGKDEL